MSGAEPGRCPNAWRAGFLGALLLLAACSGEEGDAPSAAPGHASTSRTATAVDDGRTSFGDRASLYLQASDQTSDGGSLLVEEAVLASPGWVALHSHNHRNGSVGPVIGVSELLPAGTSKGVKVTLYDAIVSPGATVYPMLHVESTANTVFDFPDGDAEATIPGVGVVVLPVKLTVP